MSGLLPRISAEAVRLADSGHLPSALRIVGRDTPSRSTSVVSGTVTETWYRAIDANRAVQTEEQERKPGYVACMLPSGPNIHRMRNFGPGEAISIHIYGFDHEVHASSIETEYTTVSG